MTVKGQTRKENRGEAEGCRLLTSIPSNESLGYRSKAICACVYLNSRAYDPHLSLLPYIRGGFYREKSNNVIPAFTRMTLSRTHYVLGAHGTQYCACSPIGKLRQDVELRKTLTGCVPLAACPLPRRTGDTQCDRNARAASCPWHPKSTSWCVFPIACGFCLLLPITLYA